MRRDLHQEGGFTLIELLLAATLMIIVLGATLTSMEGFWKTNKVNNEQNDAQDVARMTIDRLAQQLRNLALPKQTGPLIDQSIDKAEGYDLVFKTADPTRRRVRYCLQTSAPASADDGRLYMQTHPGGATADPDVANCPGAGWETTAVVADRVVNQANGKDRPVFSFNAPGASPEKITLVRSDIFVDVDPDRRPLESRISTGVYLRNQNRVPSASFTVASGGTGTRRFLLNASGSSDPEGRTLAYSWFVGAVGTPPLDDRNCSPTASLGCIGRGVTFDYTFPSTLGARPLTVQVRDPGGLTATSTWTCNPTTGTCSQP
jgi:type II secretory pathway pseudopilin PulG